MQTDAVAPQFDLDIDRRATDIATQSRELTEGQLPSLESERRALRRVLLEIQCELAARELGRGLLNRQAAIVNGERQTRLLEFFALPFDTVGAERNVGFERAQPSR